MKKVWIVGLMVMLMLAMAACGSTDSGTSETAEETGDLATFTFATDTWVGYAPFFIAQEKGFLAENGVDLNIQFVEDVSTFPSLIKAGQADGIGDCVDTSMINVANGVDECIVMAYDSSSGGDGMVASGDIQQIADLKGKTVAVNKSSTSYFFFLSVLEDGGLTEEDVTVRDMSQDAAGTAFTQGEVDAAVTWEPYLSSASDREGGHILCTTADFPNTIVDVIAVSNDYREAHPEVLEGLVAAWNQAVDWYNDGNQEEGDQIMADGLGISLEDLQFEVAGVTFYDQTSMADFFNKDTDGNIYEVAEKACQFWLERGMISEEVDVDAHISSDFAQ